jgi:hypothetical protein
MKPFTLEDLNTRVVASLVRVIEQAPIERRLPVFHLMACVAADEIAARQQQMVDDLTYVAKELGLVELLGAVAVEHAIGSALRGTRS